ncbi:MAG: hypothetical protein U9Q38_09675, partial [Thermodesulfobacteriota bacterium]|nr:hypothetical protein [Thermodesulfobacteriota bacterium]
YFIVLPAILGTTTPMVVVSSCSEAGYLNIGDVLVIKGLEIEEIKAPLVEMNSLDFKALNQNDLEYSTNDLMNNEEITQINFGGKIVDLNRSNDIVVYNTNPFFGQVIHRAFAKIKVKDKYYVITKGDANIVIDQIGFTTAGNSYYCYTENPSTCVSTLVNNNMLVGKKVLIRIPFAGHIKLFFCDIMPFCDGHSNIGTNYEYKLTC